PRTQGKSLVVALPGEGPQAFVPINVFVCKIAPHRGVGRGRFEERSAAFHTFAKFLPSIGDDELGSPVGPANAALNLGEVHNLRRGSLHRFTSLDHSPLPDATRTGVIQTFHPDSITSQLPLPKRPQRRTPP